MANQPVGRPANKLPAPIPDTPESVARACMQGPPKTKGASAR